MFSLWSVDVGILSTHSNLLCVLSLVHLLVWLGWLSIAGYSRFCICTQQLTFLFCGWLLVWFKPKCLMILVDFFFPCIEFYRQPRNLRRSWKKILKPLQWDHLRRKPQPIMKRKNKNWKSLLQKRVYEIFKVLLSDHFADRNVHLSCSVLAVGMGQIIFFYLHIDIYNTDWEFGSL